MYIGSEHRLFIAKSLLGSVSVVDNKVKQLQMESPNFLADCLKYSIWSIFPHQSNILSCKVMTFETAIWEILDDGFKEPLFC